jgi:hypothetical protein
MSQQSSKLFAGFCACAGELSAGAGNLNYGKKLGVKFIGETLFPRVESNVAVVKY